jgi:aminobenzoyl-glutamate transport protein
MSSPDTTPKTTMQRLLDVVERVGNKVPHPAIIFLILIAIVIVLSHILYLMGVSTDYQVLNPDTHELDDASASVNSLLTSGGVRFMYERLIPNFMNFTAVGLMIVAMIGAGVAEEAGLVNALIRKLVIVSPRKALAYILVFVGILASVGADAGYLVLIPLAGTAFLSVGRHPLAGLAAGFAAVAGAFTVNMLIISQFVAYFNYTNMGTILAVSMANALKDANIGPFWLLLGFIVVVAILDLLITGAIAKWAIFAPIFVPLLFKLGVDPEAVLAAYRIGDSPINAITPLNAYFALVVGFAQKYDKNAGVGTVVSLMLPYVVVIFVLWTALFSVWYLLGLPWGL